MAKFIDEWEPPKLTEKERSYGWLWILILFIALGLVVLYLMQQPRTGTQTQTVAEQVSQEKGASAGTGAPAPSAQVNVAASNAPEMNSKCTAVAGIIPGTMIKDGNKITVSFKNNGKVGIEGSYFEFASGENKIYKSNSDAVAVGETVTYTVNLDEAAGDLGSEVKSFVILPVQGGKACLNQRMVVINNG